MAAFADREYAGACAGPPMVPRVVFRSRNLEETCHFLSDNNICLEVAHRHARSLNARVHGIYLPDGLYVGSTEYGANAAVQVSPRRVDYWLLIPLQGRMQTNVHRREYISDSRRAFLFSYPAMGPSRIIVDAGAVRMTVVLSEASLRRQLAALLGNPADAPLYPPLEFAPVVDLTAECGRSIARLAQLLLADAERGGLLVRNPLALTSIEQFVINQLLLSHHHNYSAALHGALPSAAPRDVKRAIDYIEANLAAPVRLADIVQAAGVPGRTLFKHFERFHGVSPMEYVRAARYQAVHQALSDADMLGGVSELAMAWGFSHLGRFATEYCKRFGELPSDTRRRALSEHGQDGC